RLACHQSGGPGTQKILRMHELTNPWQHWFYPERPATLQILTEFQNAHGSEDYAGVPMPNVYNTRPFVMMNMAMQNGFAQQPNAFNSTQIANELAASGTSPTWAQLYANSVAGTAIPISYFTNPSDPVKLAAATTAYQQ